MHIDWPYLFGKIYVRYDLSPVDACFNTLLYSLLLYCIFQKSIQLVFKVKNLILNKKIEFLKITKSTINYIFSISI